MLNQSNVTITQGTTRKTILVDQNNSTAVSCKLSNANVSSVGNAKIIKAGTPLAGSLTNRDTAFTVASSAANCVGIAMHDVDVTNGIANGAVLIFGTVDQSKLDESVVAMLTTEIKQSLKMIQFVI